MAMKRYSWMHTGWIKPSPLLIGMLGVLFGLVSCKSVQPASAVVDRQMTGQSKIESPTAAPAPAGSSSGPTYTVKKGDTLYSIALDNGLYYKDLQSWNNLEDPNRILVGQQLRLSSSGGAQTRPVLNSAGAPTTGGQLRPAVEERALPPANASQASNTGSPTTLSKNVSEPKVVKQPYTAEAYAKLQRANSAVTAAAKPPANSINQTEIAKQEPAKLPVATGNWVWPANGKVVGNFGETGGKGMDIAGSAGDPVKAVADGRVVYVGTGLRGYGQMVIVKHDSQHLTAYAHNQKLLVSEGQSVTQGQKIAEMGNSDADRVKLHFEVRKQGKPVDPAGYLPR